MLDIPRSLAAQLVDEAWSGVKIDGGDPLGSGSSGVVWPVRDGDRQEVVKIISTHAPSRVSKSKRPSK